MTTTQDQIRQKVKECVSKYTPDTGTWGRSIFEDGAIAGAHLGYQLGFEAAKKLAIDESLKAIYPDNVCDWDRFQTMRAIRSLVPSGMDETEGGK